MDTNLKDKMKPLDSDSSESSEPIALTVADRLKVLAEDPNFAGTVMKHMGNGGDLINFCRANMIDVTDLIGWMAEDDERNALLCRGYQARDEWLRERIKSAILQIASDSVGESTRDRLKALELLGKSLGMFTENRNIKLGADASLEAILDKINA